MRVFEGDLGHSGRFPSLLKIKGGGLIQHPCVSVNTFGPRLRLPSTYRQDKSGERRELAGVLVDPLLQLQNGPCLECSVF